MKVFHRYADTIKMTPTKGDFINEIQIVNTMKRFATVTNNPNQYADLYYVRGCHNLFKKLKRPKVLFAAPYHKGCYAAADAIATFSEEWSKRLRKGTHGPLRGTPVKKKVITIRQPIHPMFKPLQGHPKTKAIRKKLGGGFIIGHYGKMRPNRIPHTLLKTLPKLKKEYPKLNIVYSDTTGFKSPFIKTMSFKYEEMPYVISASDMLILTSWSSTGIFSGLIRSKEGMRCGVPHIIPKWPARVEEFGPDYPYYHDWVSPNKGMYPAKVRNQLYHVMCKAIEDDKLRKQTSAKLLKRSKIYSVKQSAAKMEKDFKSVIAASK